MRCKIAKVYVLEHLGTSRAPLYCFRGSFALVRLPLGFPGPPLTPLWVSPGALWVRSRCYLCVFGRPLDVGPVSVLFGVGRDAIRTCLCMFCKGSPSQKRLPFEMLLGQPDRYKRGQKGLRRAGEAPRVAPETLDSYKNGAQAPSKESAKSTK